MDGDLIEFLRNQLTQHLPKLAAAYSSWVTGRRLKRIEELFRLLEKHKNRDFTEFMTSEAGYHLLESIVQRVEIEHSQAKRERFANLLIASWIGEQSPEAVYDESQLFARATAAFTEAHIAVLSTLNDEGESASMPFSTIAGIVRANTEGDSRALTTIVLQDLCSGFAMVQRSWDLNQPNKQGGLLFSGNLGPENLARDCFHAILPRGQRYVDNIVRGNFEADK